MCLCVRHRPNVTVTTKWNQHSSSDEPKKQKNKEKDRQTNEQKLVNMDGKQRERQTETCKGKDGWKETCLKLILLKERNHTTSPENKNDQLDTSA